MKIKVILLYLIIICGILTSCCEYEPILMDIDMETVLSCTAFINDCLIYKKYDYGTGILGFYSTNMNGNTVLLGEIPQYYISMRQSVVLQNKLYSYVGAYDSENNHPDNILLEINLAENDLKTYRNCDNTSLGIPTYCFHDNIATLKTTINNEYTNTFIELFDVKNNEYNTLISCSFNSILQKGNAVFGMCADDNRIYILYDERKDSEELETYLKVYDLTLKEIDSIKIEQNLHDYVMSSFISDMQVFGDYIYILNASNNGTLLRLEQGNLVEVYRGKNFECARNPLLTEPVFYTRRTKTIFILKDNELRQYEMNIENDYVIKAMLIDKNSCAVICCSEKGEDIVYCVNKKVLDKVTLQCKTIE
ncbi:MAG: hypothetical protein IJX53_08695 [Clostridia bacterium]|nr:hypothetical protein [Clostridia bacterium]